MTTVTDADTEHVKHVAKHVVKVSQKVTTVKKITLTKTCIKAETETK